MNLMVNALARRRAHAIPKKMKEYAEGQNEAGREWPAFVLR